MAAARARALLDPPEGQEPASLLAMRRALDGVMDDLMDHSFSTTSCFLNVWRRIVRAIDDNLLAEDGAENEEEPDAESETSKHSEDKKRTTHKDKKNKRKVKKEDASSQSAGSVKKEVQSPDAAAPPMRKKLRSVPLEQDLVEPDPGEVAPDVLEAGLGAFKVASSIQRPQLRSPSRQSLAAAAVPFAPDDRCIPPLVPVLNWWPADNEEFGPAEVPPTTPRRFLVPSPPSVPPPPPAPIRRFLVPTPPSVPPPCAKLRPIGAKAS